MQLDQVVPFGRSLAEYQLMFQLTSNDLKRQILDVAGGPASFNAELYQQRHAVTSIDPIYQFTGAEIRQRFAACVDTIIEQVRASPQDWVWGYHRSPDDLRHNREQALEKFLADYDEGKRQGRYVAAALPDLPDRSHYDLVLCSHFLFLYSAQLSYEFHRQAILRLLQQASELRIFPLLTLDLQRSSHLDAIQSQLESLGYNADIIAVDYELQRGANQMLRVRASASGSAQT